MAEITNPGQAEAQDVAAQESAFNNYLHARAMHALTDQYGPAAGDPTNWAKAVEAATSEAKLPYAGPQAEASVNETNARGNYLNAQTDTEKAKLPYAGPQAAASVAETQARGNYLNTQSATDQAKLPYVGAQAQADIANKNAQTGYFGAEAAHTGAETATMQAANNKNAVIGILGGLQDDVNTGADPETSWQKWGPTIAQMEHMDDPNTVEALHQMYVQDPQGTIDRVSQMLMAQNMSVVGARGAMGKGGPLTPMEQRQQMAQSLQFTQARVQNVPAAADQATSLIPQMSSSAILRKARAEIPGTPEYKFEQITHQIGGSLSLDDLRSLRENGLTLGRTNIAEFQASSNAMANMDIGQDPRALANNLQRVKGVYQGLNTDLADNMQRLSRGPLGMNNTTVRAGTPSPQGLDKMIQDAGGIDNAIAKAPNDATAQALADRYEQTHKGQRPAADSRQGPVKGAVVKGFQFLGGDPSQQSSWRKVQ